MIAIDRNRIPVPDFFSSEEYKIKEAKLKRFYRSSDRAQKRFVDYYLPENISESLHKLFNGKCAYCESNFDVETPFVQTKIDLSLTYYDRIDHFRPRNNAKGFVKSKFSADHYWWLTYEWQNLYYCCPECRNSKASWFPVVGERTVKELDYKKIIKTERNLILDPCNDDIIGQFKFDLRTGKIYSDTRKGEITIKLLDLNRIILEDRRYIAVDDENDHFKKVIKSNDLIKHWDAIFDGSSKLEFLAIRRQTILHNFEKKEYADLKTFYDSNSQERKKEQNKKRSKLVADDLTSNISVADISLLKNIQLKKIELINYKCFDELKIDFNDASNVNKEPWLVFLGENGVGKSSLIKAISIALMGQKNIDKLGLIPKKHLQYGKRVGHIRLYGKNGEFYEVRITKTKITSNIKKPTSYIIGYGSTRLLPKGNLKPEEDIEYVKIKNLFDYSVALSDAKEWLLDVKTRMFDQVAISLKDLLLLDNDDVIRRNKNKNELYIKYAKSGNRIDVSDLSDGYKTIFAITVDMIKTLSKDNLAFETAEGIILIDEIGTHLHPRWKMEVVSRLRKTFPKLQFIATTHEPLCLRGLGENEVIVLKKDTDGEIIAVTDLPSPNEFRVDQLLTSEYFGLNSTMDFETEDLFNEYYALIAKDKVTKEEQKRIDELSEILPNKKHLGDDIRDELVYYVIDQLLAKQVSDNGYKIVDDKIKKEAIDKVASIWKFLDKNNH